MIIDYFISGISGKTYTGDAFLFGDDETISLTLTETGIDGIYQVEMADPVTPGKYLERVFEGATAVGGGEVTISSEYTGTVLASPAPTTLDFATDLPQTTNDHWNGSVCRFLTGANQGKGLRITNYIGSSKILEFTDAYPAAIMPGDKFQIIGRID